ncbi:RNA polymerase subunit sigma-70 [Blautia sp. An249]|uniref:sigma-70 family RNA polymerase sigma factor n=1 Tax=Blautia sp. An249 TaxID=1965603 RepID=UPI000B38F74A|nr:sigma-70 family RNA polymerase sigma factor [Blautia sp. An249]OUO77736.1 RNA polymerase subunit sigma-70 [Blautia sp. An249]
MADYEKCTDEELIRRLRQGETEISDFLMMKYKELVRKKARAMFLIGGETDDLIQEGMIGLFKAVRDYVPGKEASFSTFAGICIERQLYNAIQGSNRQKHQPLNTYVSLSTEAEEKELRGELWADNPESIIIDRENVTDMRRQISQCLSKFENQVLEQYLQGYGYVQIAENMGKSPKSIDNALQRIRGKIREYLRKS